MDSRREGKIRQDASAEDAGVQERRGLRCVVRLPGVTFLNFQRQTGQGGRNAPEHPSVRVSRRSFYPNPPSFCPKLLPKFISVCTFNEKIDFQNDPKTNLTFK